MRPFQILCLLWGVFYSQAEAGEAREIIDKADSALVEGTDQLFDAYRLQVAAAVAKADRVELFRLKARGTETKAPGNPDDPFDDDAKNQWFKIAAPEASSARIQAKLEVPQEKLGPLIQKIADILEHPGDALAGCHDPAHGLRVYSGTELLFETSLCYSCRNFCLDSPIGGRWVPLPENGLKEMLMALLPLSEKTVLKTGLEFRLVVEEVSAETEMLPLKSKLKPESEEKLLTQRALEFSGADIVSAKSIKTRATVVDEKGNEIKSTPISISVQLSKEAGTRMKGLCEQHQGKRIAVVIDHEILMAPTMQSVFGETFMISGRFTNEEADDVAKKISDLKSTLK